MTWVFVRLLDWLIAGVFIFAGVTKIFEPARFAEDIDHYRLLPWPAVVVAALYLPWVEVASGIALVTRRWYTGALGIVTVLALVFFAALVSAKMRGLDIACGCFGGATSSSVGAALLRIVLILAAVAILWRAARRRAKTASGMLKME